MIVDKVLGSITTDIEIKKVLEDLDDDSCDVLMKYIYRCMEKNPVPSLLKMHAKLAEKAGSGCIIRAMVDRKTV